MLSLRLLSYIGVVSGATFSSSFTQFVPLHFPVSALFLFSYVSFTVVSNFSQKSPQIWVHRRAIPQLQYRHRRLWLLQLSRLQCGSVSESLWGRPWSWSRASMSPLLEIDAAEGW